MGRHGDSAYHLQKALWRIEARYDLLAGYLRAKIPPSGRAVANHRLPGLTTAERRRLAWHLLDNFNQLSPAKREEILDWVRKVVVSGSTEYRRYQAAAMRQRFAVRFSGACDGYSAEAGDEREGGFELLEPDAELTAGTVPAAPALEQEMASLLAFKTAALTSRGLQRSGVWGAETASWPA